MEGFWVAGISGALALYSLYHLARLFLRLRQIRASRDWPLAAGTVSGARVRSAGGRKRGRPYDGEVTYTYRALGTTYRGQFKTGSSFPTEERARESIRGYTPGAAVQVRYNPEKPQQSLTDVEQVKSYEWLQWLVFFILNAAVLVYSYFFW